MRTIRAAGLLAAALLTAVIITPASAQRRPIEFGIDAMLAVHDVAGPDNLIEVMGPLGGNFFSLVPLHGFRMGVFLNDRFSIEPSFGFNRMEVEDEEDALNNLGLSTTLAVSSLAQWVAGSVHRHWRQLHVARCG
jgi:hypothetical protein